MSRTVWTDADRETVRHMAREGASNGIIFDALGGRIPLGRIKNFLWSEKLSGGGRTLTATKRKAPAGKPGPRPPLFWTAERIAHLSARIADGARIDELAAEFGLTRDAMVTRIGKLRARGHALPLVQTGKPVSPRWTLDWARLLCAEAAETTDAVLSERYHVGGDTVQNWLRRARTLLTEAGEAVPPRHAGERARLAARNARIVEMRESGLSERDIARRLGITAGAVAGVLHHSAKARQAVAGVRQRRPKPAVTVVGGARVDARGVAIVDKPLPRVRPISVAPPRVPIPPVHLAKPAQDDDLPCRIRLWGELLNIAGTGPTRDPKWVWGGTVRQAKNLITRNALQGAVIERVISGASGGKHGNV